jgi:hypothetical protein
MDSRRSSSSEIVFDSLTPLEELLPCFQRVFTLQLRKVPEISRKLRDRCELKKSCLIMPFTAGMFTD